MPVGDIDGFSRYLRFLALPAVDGKTLRHLQTWIDATQPTSDVVSKLVENRMRSLKRVSRQLETRLDERCSHLTAPVRSSDSVERLRFRQSECVGLVRTIGARLLARRSGRPPKPLLQLPGCA